MKQALVPVALAALLAAASAAQAETATYAIDPTHTFVHFEFPHFNTSTFRGRLQAKEGTVQLDRAAKSGKVDISFDMSQGFNTGVAALDKHLQSPDFFDVANSSSARFVADKVRFDGDKVAEVSGQLTLRGKTNPVVLKATRFNCYTNPMLKREACGGDFETTIPRFAYGVDWGKTMGAPDNVHLLIQVEGIKQ